MRARSPHIRLLTDKNHRCVSVAEILVEKTIFHILEVDTSDAINSLSTQILLLNTPYLWPKQLGEIERALIKRSLVWPKHLFDKFCGAGRFMGIPHPKSSASGKGLLDPDSVINWADRFHRLIKTMLR